MNDLIIHRGPDGEGYHIENGLAIGHRLLRITGIDGDSSQPMHFNDTCISFNGEVYNHYSLRKELQKLGYHFATSTDTEVILKAYDCWGVDCLDHFVGMWAFVIYDRKKQVLFCSRDRFGIKPLYYEDAAGEFLIGSEAKQLALRNGRKNSLNHRVAYDFLLHAMLNCDDETFFDGIKAVLPGHNLIYDLARHRFSIHKWYDLDKIQIDRSIRFEDAVVQFKKLFTESVAIHSYSEVFSGACLSGGLDSSSIVSVMDKYHTRPEAFSTVSSLIPHTRYNEEEYVQAVLADTGHASHRVHPDIHELIDRDLMDKIVYNQDQPILTASFFSEYKVFQTAAENRIKVMLSGQGADEYLIGYDYFIDFHLKSLLRKGQIFKFLSHARHYSSNQGRDFSPFVKRLFKDATLPTARHFYHKLRNSKSRPAFSFLDKKWVADYSSGSPLPTHFTNLNSLGKRAIADFSLPHQLHSEDRNSMLFSIESRLPFLDHRLVEYCLALPDDFKVHDGVSKYILRESMKDSIPDKIYNRHMKLGFPGPPDQELFLNGSFGKIEKGLEVQMSVFPQIFQKQTVQIIKDVHLQKRPYDDIYFRIFNFLKWAKCFDVVA